MGCDVVVSGNEGLPLMSSMSRFFFVAPRGDDRNDGSYGRPFTTLHRAQRAVRAVREGGRGRGPVTVFVRGGTYYLREPLTFTADDSGAAEAAVCFSAYPGEDVTISGGTPINAAWEPYCDGILRCRLPAREGAMPSFTQLFVNGVRQTRARFPKDGFIRPAAVGPWPHRFLVWEPRSFTRRRWGRPQNAVVHIFPRHRWGNLQWQVRSVDWARNTVHFGRGGHQLNELFQGVNATGLDTSSDFFVENVFEELDAPGEWYLDEEAGVLYLKPPLDVDVRDARVEAPLLREVVRFDGSRSRPVRHVTLKDFRIAHTASVFLEPYEIPSLGDWAIHRSGAVRIEGAEDCRVEGCRFDGVGGNGVFVNRYARRVDVHGNEFADAGESAICLVGRSHLRTDVVHACAFCGAEHAWGWGEPLAEHPADCAVTDNLIHDIGVFGKQTAGVFLSLCARIRVGHNHIYDTPRAAICINDGCWGGHVIEFNDVHDTVRETNDHGPFNAWGRDQCWCKAQAHGPASHPAGDVLRDARETTVVRNNRFRDTKGWGIDLDDGASNYHVHDNLCIGISIKLREGDHRLVENNVFINPASPPGLHVGCEGNHDRFVRNIVVTHSRFENPDSDINFRPPPARGCTYQVIFPPLLGRIAAEIDFNVFLSDRGAFCAQVVPRGSGPWDGPGDLVSLEGWRAMGYDRHSAYADPMFVDPQRRDFRVKPESPAIERGFRNFRMDQYGPRIDERSTALSRDVDANPPLLVTIDPSLRSPAAVTKKGGRDGEA